MRATIRASDEVVTLAGQSGQMLLTWLCYVEWFNMVLGGTHVRYWNEEAR
jgi:hypothetical protein